MAFNGSISEFGVVALLQLPGTNHLSGKLILIKAEQKADFFYIKGKLTHASLNDMIGKEVLLHVIDWLEGEFSFDSNATTDQQSIKQDLQNTLMWALKERDELNKQKADKELAEKEQAEKEKAALELAEAEARELKKQSIPVPIIIEDDFFNNLSLIQTAFLLNLKGQILAKGHIDDESEKHITPLLAAVQNFIFHYPLETFKKAFIEDSSYTIALSKFKNDFVILIIVPSNTKLGLLSIELSKFIRLLQSSGLDILND